MVSGKAEPGREDGTRVPPSDDGVGTRLRRVVKALGGNAAAGRIAGVSDEMISRYLTGKAKPSYAAVAAMVGAAGLSLDWLETGVEPTPPSASHPLDADALATAIAIVEGWIDDRRLHMPPSKKAKVVATIYEMYLEDQAAGRPPIDADRAKPILKLVVG